MGEVISLSQRITPLEISASDRYALQDPGSIDGYSKLLTVERLASLRCQIQQSLTPASRTDRSKAVAVLAASFKIGDVLEDRGAFALAMIEELDGYPLDVIDTAIRTARRTLNWLPSIAEMITLCDAAMNPRLRRLHSIDRMEGERERRRAEAEAAARVERERRERFEKLEAQAHQLLGTDAPLRGDIELAGELRTTVCLHQGRIASWFLALGDGEPWAAAYCRKLALVARLKRANDRGLISAERAIAIAQTAADDEPNARRQIEALESGSAIIHFTEPELKPNFEAAISAIQLSVGVDPIVHPTRAERHQLAALSPQQLKRVFEECKRFELLAEDDPRVLAIMAEMGSV